MAPNFDKPADQKAMNEPDLDALRKQQIPALQKRVGMVLDTLDAQLNEGEESALVAGPDTHTRGDIVDSAVVPAEKPATEDASAPKLRNMRRRKGVDASVNLKPVDAPAPVAEPAVDDAVSAQAKEELQLATEIQDTQIKSLQAQYEHDPRCVAVLEKLAELVGKNPDNSVIDGMRKELEVLAPEEDDASAQPAPLAPIQRVVNIPVVDANPVPTPEPTPSPVLESMPLASIELPAEITVKGLLKMVPDTKVIVIKKTGKDQAEETMEFRRDGDRFVTTAKKPRQANNALIRALTHGFRIDTIDGVAVQVATPDVAPAVPPAVPDAVIPADAVSIPDVPVVSDAVKVPDATGEKNEQYELRMGDVWVHAKEKVTVRVMIKEFRKKDGVDMVVLDTDRTDESGQHVQGYPMESVLTNASVIDLLRGRFTREGQKDEKKETFKLPEVIGDKVYFTGTNGDGTIEKVTDGYKVEYANPMLIALGILTEAQVQEQGEKEDWLPVEKMTRPAEMPRFVPTLNDVITPGDSQKEALRGFQPLNDGERAHYYIPGKKLSIVVEKAHGVYVFSPGGNSVLYTEEDIAKLAQTEGWEFSADSLTPEDFEKKPLKLTEAEKQKEHIAELRALVEEARFSYVETDYKQDNAFKKLKRFFGGALGGDRGDPDTEGTRTRYNLALTNLKEAELDLLKKSGISGKELKEEMVRILNYYTLGERVQLKLDHQRVEAEDTKWSGRKVLANFEKLGNWYKSLSPKTRLIAGGLGLALGGVSLVAGGTGVGVLAGGAVLLKKIVTTSASGVFADGLLEAGEDWCKKWLDIRRQTERVQELEALNTPMKKFDSIGISEEAFEKLSQLTQADIDSLDKKFQKQKRDQAWRKTVAWSTAGGVGAYFLLHSSLFGGGQQGVSAGVESQEARLERLAEANRLRREMGASAPGAGTMSEAVEAASAPASAASVAEQAHVVPSTTEQGTTGNIPRVETTSTTRTVVSPEVTARVASLRGEYTVNADGVNDGQKGLYGILERRLAGSGLTGVDEQQAIESLAKAMRIKLDAMTPDERALAGFHGTLENGKVNLDLIRPGDKIDFGKLLTPEEIQSVLDGETIETPVEALSGSVVERAIPDVVSPAERTEILRGFQDGPGGLTNGTPVMTEEWANTPARNPGEVAASLRSPVPEIVTLQDLGNPARLEQFMSEHGELNRSYQGTLRGMKTAIFSLPQDMNKLPYIEQVDGGFNSSMAMANMDRVLETHQGFRMGTMTAFEYDRRPFPFKSSQVERLAHLVRVATDPNMFGPVGRPLPGEFVGTYLERMAALAAATHNEKALAVSFRALYRQ